ncbi:hypothetical protein LTR06_010862 [Exophiala xenobiotica]|nr:hypothetical protein LTR06_010862 [Exophiala xenobiotica]
MAVKTLADVRNKSLLRNQGFIDGRWVDAISGRTFDVVDPASLDKLASIPEMGTEDTVAAVEAAHSAFKTFKDTTARERARLLRRWNDLCLQNIEDLALILSLENGKTLAEARGEVVYGASFIEWFAGEAERSMIQHPEIAPANGTKAAGCTTVWKPAGETPLSALAQAVLALEAGIPAGAINVVTTMDLVAKVGTELCTNKLVKKLSFTGSTRVGKMLMTQCASNVKKMSMELGGNSPLLVFDDAQIGVAVEVCILAKFRNSGQTCVTANRIFVQSAIYDEFAAALTRRIKDLKVGPGTEEDVFIGPLTHDKAVDKAMRHIKSATDLGAKVILGGGPMPEKHGYFLQPTVLTNMNSTMLTTHEEVFAPVVPLYRFDTEEEVIEKANDCDVGLGGFVVTSDISRSWRVTEKLEVGMVGVNLGSLSACENPFGGVKESGFGREGGRHGIDEYMAVKSMFINVST